MRRRKLQPVSTPGPDKIPKQVFDNVDELLRARAHLDKQLGVQHRIADVLTGFGGTLYFLGLIFVACVIWIGLNLGLVPSVKPFDPYPFGLLGVCVSVLALLVTTVVLMSQNRTQELVDRRDELNLHVSLLIESETTSILKKIARLEEVLQIKVSDAEASHVSELVKDTNPTELASSIELSTQKFEESPAAPSLSPFEKPEPPSA